MSDIKRLQEIVVKHRDDRDWKQYHQPKDETIALALEAAELMEPFRWLNLEEQLEYVKKNNKHLGEELADVLYWVLLMAHDFNVDLVSAYELKMAKNAALYPVEKAKGKNKKYTEYKV